MENRHFCRNFQGNDMLNIKQDLINQYSQLPIICKKVLQIIALNYEPMAQSPVFKLCKNIGLNYYNGKTYVLAEHKFTLKLLEDRHLILKNRHDFSCNPLLLNEVEKDALTDGLFFKKCLKVIRAEFPLISWGTMPESFNRCMRELRFSLLEEDFSHFQEVYFNAGRHFPAELFHSKIIEKSFIRSFSPKQMEALPEEMRKHVLIETIHFGLNSFKNIHPVIQSCRENEWICKEDREEFESTVSYYYILKGEWEQVAPEIRENQPDYSGKHAIHRFLRNEESALELFHHSLKNYQEVTHTRKKFLPGLEGFFFVLALIREGSSTNFTLARTLTNNALKAEDQAPAALYRILKAYFLAKENNMAEADEIIDKSLSVNQPLVNLAAFIVASWIANDYLTTHAALLDRLYQLAGENIFGWARLELGECIASTGKYPEAVQAILSSLKSATGYHPLAFLFRTRKDWERALSALAAIETSSRKSSKKGESRIIWLIHFPSGRITPREQKRSKNGKWSNGRSISLARLKRLDIPNLSEQDKKLANVIREYPYRGSIKYMIHAESALPLLIGHPCLFLEDSPETPVELIEETPELMVRETGNFYEMWFPVEYDFSKSFQVIGETLTRFKLIRITGNHQKVLNAMGKQKIRIPITAKDELQKTIKNLSELVTVNSSLVFEDIPTVKASSKMIIQMLPIGESLKCKMLVHPFQTGGPYFPPGHGRETLLATLNGKKLQTQRDLSEEQKEAYEIIRRCPELSKLDSLTDEIIFEEPQECLQLLLELKNLGIRISVEWPEGERIRLHETVSFEQMKLKIRKESNWFHLDGAIQVNEELTLSLQEIIDKMQHSPEGFIHLGQGHFLALAREFRKRLDDLATFADMQESSILLHPLAAPALQDFTEKAGNLETDVHWSENIKRLNDLNTINPKLTNTFQTELRSYQQEGFKWLSKMAHWGAGCCLADDMGLGKTVQALAMLLERAPKGPSIVVAPASVCRNWLTETQRFAPTLQPLMFAGNGRKELLQELKPFDLLITSYGLLQSEADILSQINWNVVVLDEAHAIKNASTKRSKATMQLNGDFKVLITGTPIQNHLGELWNLFNFINPGLLGSSARFAERYVNSETEEEAAKKRRRLQKLIRPFILRRTKTQVLDDLPEKTEIMLSVDLSEEEYTLYEILRQKALSNMEKEQEARQRQIQILAEITRLRQACCHPRLVAPESEISGAKLELFLELTANLIENGHKALVFSQFTSHLALIREQLDKKKIAYQYLDGSTSWKQREEQVNDFQAGKGDLFLISLKAGGLGLNLTAADYVIHMDPWWNPAVEDQASDRAYRYGQNRPVTIYRMVAKNTIEEKIVKLHHDKRELAGQLLEGTDQTSKISVNELMNLLQEA